MTPLGRAPNLIHRKGSWLMRLGIYTSRTRAIIPCAKLHRWVLFQRWLVRPRCPAPLTEVAATQDSTNPKASPSMQRGRLFTSRTRPITRFVASPPEGQLLLTLE